MFYPVDSLRKGGRFYLCWVADSWPVHFETIPQRQLWSQDVRKICDALLEVITNESGRPSKRFSLRLSSQLLHGLVRLYQRKVKVLLGDLYMINANVFRRGNKKFNMHDEEAIEAVRRHPKPLQPLPIQAAQEVLEEEQRIEEMIQNSNNVVANIQDITLKESVIPELQVPNDGFGEENSEAPLLLLQDRTLEMMLRADGAHAHSALDFVLDVTDKSHDKTRLAPHESAQMETVEEHDLTMFRKSTGMEYVADFEKDIPEIPEIPPPELPVPQPDKVQEEVILSPEPPGVVPPPEIPIRQEPVEIELEELEDQPQAKRRRLKNKLVVDKKTKLTANFIRARIDNPLVELRCEDSSDDIIVIWLPPEVYFRRPGHAGPRAACNVGFDLTRLFHRNLGPVHSTPRADRHMETAMPRTIRAVSQSMLERIEEEQDLVQEQPQLQQPMEIEQMPQVNVTGQAFEVEGTKQTSEVGVTRGSRVSVDPADISEMLTQKIETLSQQRKRLTEQDPVESPKRQRSGYMSFRETQQRAKERSAQKKPSIDNRNIIEADLDGNKENIPDNIQRSPPNVENQPEHAEMVVSAMLQESGLADIMAVQAPEVEQQNITASQARQSKRKTRSESSETPLGSLDRTRVSLGDSDQTTDSKRFIRNGHGYRNVLLKSYRCEAARWSGYHRLASTDSQSPTNSTSYLTVDRHCYLSDHWGTEGAMIKILKFIKAGLQPVTIRALIARGPLISGHKRVIAARCFNSVLKLKQHGFINIAKDHEKLEIRDITLGPKLTNSSEPF